MQENLDIVKRNGNLLPERVLPVHGGTVFATTQETPSIVHKSMVPPYVEGTLIKIVADGSYTVNEVLGTVLQADGTLAEESADRNPTDGKKVLLFAAGIAIALIVLVILLRKRLRR